MFDSSLLQQVRSCFAHVDSCPYQGERAFFENAGGSLTLNSVVETTSRLAAIPDNQGRDNPASHELVRLINESKRNIMTFLGTSRGMVFVGESGTELLFRMIRAAVLAKDGNGDVLGSSLEHPATVSACRRWAGVANKNYIQIEHNPDTAMVTAEDYAAHVTPDTHVATIIQTSPVSGTALDVESIVKAVRAVSPNCFIVVDGIQHAAHGALDLDAYNVDGFAVSAYKVFSKHNYGVAWLSERLSTVPHDKLDGTADDFWEMGTRDTSAYATFTDVVNYLEWLGSEFTTSDDLRDRLVAAGKAMQAHEHDLVQLMINGDETQSGLRDIEGVFIVGGADNPHREGLVSMTLVNMPSAEVVTALNDRGIRTHVRKNDYFSGNILNPLNMETCVRVSLCHYNSPAEVKKFLALVEELAST
ncbi:MAG: aminotransferase class V-fold PLP-dependent enzyme [Pseudomonadota bacterium]